MAIKTANKPALVLVSSKAAPRPTITDAMRNEAYALPSAIRTASAKQAAAKIAPLAFAESRSRDETVAAVRGALGLKPGQTLPANSPADTLAYIRGELVNGRVASRIPASLLPRKGMDSASIIAFVRDQRTFYARPVEEGKTAGALPKGKLGRMDARLYQAVRTAESWATLVLADAGLTSAEGQKAKNDKAADKRAPHGKTSQTGKGKPDKPVINEPAKPVTASDVTGYLAVQLNVLATYVRKHAAIVPGEAGTIIERAVREMLACDKATRDAAKAK